MYINPTAVISVDGLLARVFPRQFHQQRFAGVITIDGVILPWANYAAFMLIAG
ncbi:hypothetical protein L208DRAFT_1395928 [Tricholoma matsutake]|nr:hypothetical protein L208DRAFT_1395928 [Tricholoma matsutake 945]